MVQIKIAIAEAIQLAPKMVEKVVAAHNKELPTLADIVSKLCKDNNWPEEREALILGGTESLPHEYSVMSLVNGLTYASQHVDNWKEREDMELLAGDFLMAVG